MGTTISDPLVGSVLDRRYRVDSRIARGGMATVYRAQDGRLDRTVALKAMHPSLAEDDSFVSRFIGEAKSAARLSHPNVVSVYDQGSDDGVVFLTMEYLPGRTVRELLAERGRLEPDEALRITTAVLGALGAAHQAELVHRDVKPENVLLGDGDAIKVGDFGLARAIAASNHTKTSGLLIGTVAYLSPEQVSRGVADPRSDVYSAGILLYELLTGSPPFDGETPIAVAYKHVNSDVPPPSSVVPELPADVDALVAAATRREPEQRPADASELLSMTSRTRARLTSTEREDDVLEAGDGRHETLAWSRNGTLVVPTGEVAPDPYAVDAAETGDEDETDREAHAAANAADPPGPSRRRRVAAFARSRRGIAVLVAAALLVVSAGGAGYYYGWGRWTEAPPLAEMTLSAATQKARGLGFDVRRADPKFHNTVPEGHVISADPTAGERILRGGTVTLVPSRGKRRVAVPELQGKPFAAAKKQIGAAGLTVGEVSRSYSASVPIGNVIGTQPPVGEKITIDSQVDITRSAGVEVPRIAGRPLGEATSALEGKGFAVEVVEKSYSSDVSEGSVIAQDPSDGGAEKGSTVQLTVSKGPEPVQVPDVVGQGADEAEKALREAGFEVQVHDLPFPGSEIRQQRPEPGTERRPGSTVTLFAW